MILSICIVNWNTKKYLQECIGSIINNTTGLEYEIVVVDNLSNDDSFTAAKDSFRNCVYIQNSENVGFAKANNIAWKAAAGKYILFLNPDVLLLSNTFPHMVAVLEQDASIGIVGCKLLNKDGSIQITSARTYPSPANQFFSFSGLSHLLHGIKLFSSEDMEYWDHGDSRFVDVVSGACMMTRREILDKTGGFCEDYYMYSEDVDLCFRVKHRLKYKVFYYADEKIIHFGGASSSQRKEISFVPVMIRKSQSRFLQINFGKGTAVSYRGSLFFASIIRIFSLLTLSLLFLIQFKINQKLIMILKNAISTFLWTIGIEKHEANFLI